MTSLRCGPIAVACCLVAAMSARPGKAETGWLEPLPYSSEANSPLDLASGTVVLENFEDGALPPGVTVVGGRIIGPEDGARSVDGDDGVIDGSGRRGHALFAPTGRLVFYFDPAVLGGLPQVVGIVVTDRSTNGTPGVGVIDRLGDSFGIAGSATNAGARDACGETADDRFIALFSTEGIHTMGLGTTDETAFQVDHLQFSTLASTTAPLVSSRAATSPPARCSLPSDLLASRIASRCPCAEARNRRAHVRCARDAIRYLESTGLLPHACRSDALSCVRKSTCGLRHAVTCCTADGCRVERNAAACTARRGTAGAQASCCAACAASSCFPAPAAPITASECLATRLEARGALRACRADARARAIEGSPVDAASCDGPFEDALASIITRAVDSGVGCRYVDNGDDTVTDLLSGLTWLRPVDAATSTWLDAMPDLVAVADGRSSDGSNVGACSANHCDWRIPTVVDVITTSKRDPPCTFCIDPIFLPMPSGGYWTSTRYSLDPELVWVMDIGALGLIREPPDAAHHRRAVRGGREDWPGGGPPAGNSCQAAKLRALGALWACRMNVRAQGLRGGGADGAACDGAFAAALSAAGAGANGAPCRFLDNGDGTVIDLDHGLTWEHAVLTAGEERDWRAAMTATVAERNGGGTNPNSEDGALADLHDWRAPTIAELMSLFDCAGTGQPCVDVPLGATWSSLPYWSSSTDAGDSTRAWGVVFESSSTSIVSTGKTGLGIVRAVRGGLD